MTIYSIDSNKDGFIDGTSLPVINEKINQDIRKSELDSFVELFSIDLSLIGGNIFHFVKGIRQDGLPVLFGGVNYFPIDFETDGWEMSTNGPQPRPSVRIARPNSPLFNMIRDANDLVGCNVVRMKTFRKYLDDGYSPDPHAHFPVEYYRIISKTAANRLYIEFELGNQLDRDNDKAPVRRILRDYCSYRYRSFDVNSQKFKYKDVTCPYAGETYFSSYGKNVSNPQEDSCGKQLADCKLRFGSPMSFNGLNVTRSPSKPTNPKPKDVWINTGLSIERIYQACESVWSVYVSGSTGNPPSTDDAYFPYSAGDYWGNQETNELWRYLDSKWVKKTVITSETQPSTIHSSQYWYRSSLGIWFAYSIEFYVSGNSELPFSGFPGAGALA